MARKRSTPKPPAADLPASIPFTDEMPEDVTTLLEGTAAMMAAIRMRRVVLQRSQVVADPDGLDDDGRNILSLEPPESEYQFDPKSRQLRIRCHCRLTASRGATTGRKKKGSAVPLLIVEASFLMEYEVLPEAAPHLDDALVDAFSDVAVAQAWPYWREFVRDASTRAGLPVIDVPFDVEF